MNVRSHVFSLDHGDEHQISFYIFLFFLFFLFFLYFRRIYLLTVIIFLLKNECLKKRLPPSLPLPYLRPFSYLLFVSVERVVLSVLLNHTSPGDLRISFSSPISTESVVAEARAQRTLGTEVRREREREREREERGEGERERGE